MFTQDNTRINQQQATEKAKQFDTFEQFQAWWNEAYEARELDTAMTFFPKFNYCQKCWDDAQAEKATVSKVAEIAEKLGLPENYK